MQYKLLVVSMQLYIQSCSCTFCYTHQYHLIETGLQGLHKTVAKSQTERHNVAIRYFCELFELFQKLCTIFLNVRFIHWLILFLLWIKLTCVSQATMKFVSLSSYMNYVAICDSPQMSLIAKQLYIHVACYTVFFLYQNFSYMIFYICITSY